MAVDMKNIFLENVTEPLKYKSSSHPVSKNYPIRKSVSNHASYIRKRFDECHQQELSQRQVAAIKCKQGMYLEFSGKTGYELATKSLESRQQGIRLLNVRNEEDGTTRATVYVPEGKISYYLKKIDAYASDDMTPKGRHRNEDLIGSIEDVKLAVLESFWLDKKEEMPGENAIRCEIWLRYEIKTRGNNIDTEPEKTVDRHFKDVCVELGISVDSKSLFFPERVVKLITVNREMLVKLITAVDYITEIRRAEEPNSFFEDLSVKEQKEWVQDLLARTSFERSGVSVCLLDAGLNSNHPLLIPAIDKKHIRAYDALWGTEDNANYRGHGTEMAGIALYYDLKDALIKKGEIMLPHEIESVKILPPAEENPRNLYGAITEQSVLMADIANPSNNRVLCMAVTANDNIMSDGRPTSWSAALDRITSGADEEGTKRLFIVSAGNVMPSEFEKQAFPDANINHSVENPAQSWNAITVGAYSKSVEISDLDFKNFNPVASSFQLSPYSSTSLSWSNKWPIKPEVLFDGGNMMTNGTDYDSCPELSLLTLGHRLSSNLFSVIWGTSSATAQAAWFAAQLEAEYPDMWPETVRALMIHSAEWPDEMKEQFCKDETKKRDRRNLLRACGYGIPNLERAIQCMSNSVNMIIQSDLQPYTQKSMNEMHIHSIPWPKEVLRDLGDIPVKLRITLSYYIEPSPGEVGWKDRYRYPSCGLRFEVNRPNQGYDDFKRHVNVLMRDEEDDEENQNEGTAGSNRWYLGVSRNSGSIHSDFMIENAVDLCECNFVAVYPIGGWWKERTYLGRYNHKVRYSLIVSLTTPETDVDLYTPIMNQINNSVTVSISS